jgi:hypothetical protein
MCMLNTNQGILSRHTLASQLPLLHTGRRSLLLLHIRRDSSNNSSLRLPNPSKWCRKRQLSSLSNNHRLSLNKLHLSFRHNRSNSLNNNSKLPLSPIQALHSYSIPTARMKIRTCKLGPRTTLRAARNWLELCTSSPFLA